MIDKLFKEYIENLLKDHPKQQYPFMTCSFDLWNKLRNRYPKRLIRPNGMIDYKTFYYYARSGELRIVVDGFIMSQKNGVRKKIRKYK